MEISGTRRLGLVVPPENPTAEPEFALLLRSAMYLHTARFPTTPGRETREMLAIYNESVADVLANFGTLRLDATLVACNASHYLLSPDGDQRLCDQLSHASGFLVQSSAGATLSALRALGVSRVTLVSPYEPWLTVVSQAYWQEAGIIVDRVVQVGASGGFNPYVVTTQELLAQLGPPHLSADAAVLFTGTGMFTLAALTELGRRPDQVVMSSNLASAWWALRSIGYSGGSVGRHPLVARLARQATEHEVATRTISLSRGRSGSPHP